MLPVLSHHGSPSMDGRGWSRDLEKALQFLAELLPILTAYEVPTFPIIINPILIYTDGMYEPPEHSTAERAAIGFIAYFPMLDRWFHSWLDMSAVCALFRPQKTHIGRVEAMGVLVAVLSLLSHSATAACMHCAPVFVFHRQRRGAAQLRRR